MNPKFEVLQMSPTFTNSVLVSADGECVIFDAWGLADDWDRVLADRGLKLRGIYSTHGHYDHISAAPELARRHDVPWYLNHSDEFMISWSNIYLAEMGMPPIPNDYKKPLDVSAGDVEVLGVPVTVIETPGHSAGGVAFYFPTEKTLIIGDTIFQDCVGRWDLPGSDQSDLFKSVSKIYKMDLPDDTVVIHGHGENTTIGFLRKNNPWFKK